MSKHSISSVIIKFLCLVLLFVGSQTLYAQDEEAAEEGEASEAAAEGEEGAPAADQAIYLPLKPPFIINYGGAGRLRYLKTELSVRVASIDAANAVRTHMPWVRNNLLRLFGSQTNETVSSQDGKEAIRSQALEEIRDIVEREEGMPRDVIVEVFFNNFVVQK